MTHQPPTPENLAQTLRDMLDWMRWHTSPTMQHSPHALMSDAAAMLAQLPPSATVERYAPD